MHGYGCSDSISVNAVPFKLCLAGLPLAWYPAVPRKAATASSELERWVTWRECEVPRLKGAWLCSQHTWQQPLRIAEHIHGVSPSLAEELTCLCALGLFCFVWGEYISISACGLVIV